MAGSGWRKRLVKVVETIALLMVTIGCYKAVAGACDLLTEDTSSSTGDAAVVSVLEETGVFEINDGNPDRATSPVKECKVSIVGATLVNAEASQYYSPTKSSCGLTTSGSYLERVELFKDGGYPRRSDSNNKQRIQVRNSGSLLTVHKDSYYIINKKWCKNNKSNDCGYTSVSNIDLPDLSTDDRTFVFNNGEYDYVWSLDGSTIYFKYDGSQDPFMIDQLKGTNTAKMYMEPGDYYIREWDLNNSQIYVADYDEDGNPLGDGSGQVRVYLYNGDTGDSLTNGGCINIDGCYENGQVTSADEQNASRFLIYVHKGGIYFRDRVQVAAGIYVEEGDFLWIANSGTTFIGEIIAESFGIRNNSDVYMIYQESGIFDLVYGESSGSSSSTESMTVAREGEFSLANSAVASETSTGSYTYIPSQTDNTDDSGITGHLKAFAMNKDGTTSSTASWDVNALMTVEQREERLWSTNSSGTLTLLSALDNAAFDIDSTTLSALISSVASSTSSQVSLIKSYTFDPNHDSGAYLGDRDSSAMIGAPYTTQPKVMGDLVVFQTDDGFVYGVDATSGELIWGFIPRVLVAELQNFDEFYTTHSMDGQISVLPSSTGATDGYIVGSAQSGALHYALKVDSSGKLDNVLWVDEQTSSVAHAPVVMNIGSQAYAIYLVGEATVKVRTLSSSYSETTFDVSSKVATLTAAPMVHGEYVLDSSKSYKVQSGDIYLGDSEGDIYYGELVASNSLVRNLSLTSLGNIGTSSDVEEPIRFLEHITSSAAEYVTAQSDTRLKTFRIPVDENKWLSTWTSYNSGSGYWSEDGKRYTAETSFTPNTEHIQKLPENASITAKATVAASVVFLPVQIDDEDECSAYYYLYNLGDGFFPVNTIYRSGFVEDNVKVGNGTVFQANVVVHNGDVVVQGGSETNSGELLGVDDTFVFTVSPGGRSGWREVTGE